MKILIFSPKFHPFRGGLENFALELATRLGQHGHTVTVLTHNHDHLPAQSTHQGMRITRLDAWNILKDVYSLPLQNSPNKRIWKQLEQEGFDVVFTNTRFFMTSLQGTWFARKHRVPQIHIEHGNVFVRHNNPFIWLLSRIYEYTFGAWIFRRAWKVIGISKPCAAFARRMGAKKVRMIPNAIDTTVADARVSRESRPAAYKGKTVITFVGRLIYAKGVQDLIHAMQGMQDVVLCVVGDGPYKTNLQGLAKECHVPTVFWGTKNLTDMYRILSWSDIFVNPSYSEGLPTSVLEAGAKGLAIVATAVGGTGQIIQNNKSGLLYTPKDHRALGRHIRALAADPALRKQLGGQLKERVRITFDWNHTIDAWITELPRT